MKQLFFILCISLAAVTLSSCSDKDDIPAEDALTGTVWSQTDGNRTDTFYFGINHSCTFEWKYYGFKPIKQKYRYTYKAPNVTVETGANTFTGRIEGDVLSIRIFDRDLALKKIR